MLGSGYCLGGKNNYSPHLSLTVLDIIQESKTLIPELFPFMHPVQGPSLGHETSSRAKYRSTHTSSSDRRHMVLMTKDSLETRSTQTHIHKSVCIFIYTHTIPTQFIGEDGHIYI